jgi:hypothetical protein
MNEPRISSAEWISSRSLPRSCRTRQTSASVRSTRTSSGRSGCRSSTHLRSLANYPDYLESAWGHLAPVLRTRAFETASDELRARALLEPVPDASGADWETRGGRRGAGSPTARAAHGRGDRRLYRHAPPRASASYWTCSLGLLQRARLGRIGAAAGGGEQRGEEEREAEGCGNLHAECGLGGAAAPNLTYPASASRLLRLR